MDVANLRVSRDLSWWSIGIMLALSVGISKETVILRRVYELIRVNETIPFCYTMYASDLVCFWESSTLDNSSYTFEYSFEDEDGKSCELTTEVASANSWWHICNFPSTDVVSFTPIYIEIKYQDSMDNLYQKTIYTDRVVLMEPPGNLTVTELTSPRMYLVSWGSPAKWFEDRISYQVNYFSTDQEMHPMEVLTGQNKVILTELSAHTHYTFRVRAKINGYTYQGYWSEWTPPVTIYTDFDPFHIVLFVIGAVMVVIIPLMVLLKYNSFIKHMIWPQVPTPESHFKDFFTTHKGNFKQWLGPADNYFMWLSRQVFHENPCSAVEVLSEMPSSTTSPGSAVRLPPKDNYVVLNEKIVPLLPGGIGGRWPLPSWMELQWREPNKLNPQSEESLMQQTRLVGYDLAETPSSEISHPESGFVEGSSRQNSLEETFRPERGFIGIPKAETDWMKVSCVNLACSEEGKQSPSSSFEYTIVENCEGLLSAKPHPTHPSPPSLKYAYLLMSDSGGESPPLSPNIYQNNCLLPSVYSQS
ncbi:erythropoietin receptor [Pelodytes ibericus]